MKRRVSFLLMLILAITLTIALSSCGECEHVATDTRKEITVQANCKTVEQYEEVVYCVDCNAEISRTAKKGSLGSCVPGEPVYEYVDTLSCTEGGKGEKVVYCTVARCGVEISREDVTVPARDHVIKTRTFWFVGEYKNAHTPSAEIGVLEYCANCPYQNVREMRDSDIDKQIKRYFNAVPTQAAHDYKGNVCMYCFDVQCSAGLKYELNADGQSYTVTGITGSKDALKTLYIGTHKDGKPVTAIAPEAFKDCTALTNVYFGSFDGGLTVGADAFAGCSAIISVFTWDIASWSAIDFANLDANPVTASSSSVSFYINEMAISGLAIKNNPANGVLVIPDGVTSIGDFAFANVKAHTVYVPASVKYIGEGAFAGSTALRNIHFAGDAEFEADAFVGCTNLENVYVDSIDTWVKNSFADADANPAYHADNFYVDGAIATEIEISAGATSIGAYLFANVDITKIVIPASVTAIGDGAFINCSALVSVDLGSVKTIGALAFSGCTALASVTVPATVTSIGESAFENCTALGSVAFAEEIGEVTIAKNAFKGCTALAAVALPETLTEIEESAFANCTSLVTVTLGNNIEKIKKEAFAGCTALESINFTANIDEIHEGAFKNCSSLKKILLNSGLKTIAPAAFEGCASATEISVPDSVTEIGFGAFKGCSKVESIKIPFVGNKVDSEENNHFGFIFGAELIFDDEGAPIPPNNRDYVPYTLQNIEITLETVIGRYAFSGCESIVTVKLPESITLIEAYAFEECTSLSAVYFPDLAKWCKVEFETYSANPLAYANELYIAGELLTTLTVPAGVTEILPFAFYGASEIVEIVIGEGVTAIGRDAFSHCIALTKVSLPASLVTIGARAFVGCDAIETVNIAEVESWCEVQFGDIFANPLYYTEALSVAGEQVTELVISGVSAINAYAFAGCDFLLALTISDGVATIADYAFYNCSAIKALALPASVKSVGDSAFAGCSALKSVDLASVATIGNKAFEGCSALEAIVIPNTVTKIGNSAFSGCASAASVTIGSSVTSIGISAFYGCEKLAAVIIPASVTVIGAHAFSECDALAAVTFEAAAGWNVNGEAVEGLETDALAALKALASYEWTK